MRIGIVTYHAAKNYGAFLQAYALKNAIIEYTGNEVEIINFDMPQAEALYKRPLASTEGKYSVYANERYKMFEREEDTNLSSQPRLVSGSIEDFQKYIKGKYDAIIAGSDEIWKMDGFRGFPNPYWLPGNYECKKYSFAASSRTDVSKLSEEEINEARILLSDFSYIGVRDEVTRKFVRTITGINPHLNCDPTFAYDFKINKELGRWLLKNKFHLSGQKKVIAVMLENRSLYNTIVQMYGDFFDFVPIHNYYPGLNNAVLTPFEWIQAIAGSDGLICNHFHGTVFALKSNTPFIVFELREITDNRYSKIYDLLQRHNLEQHFHMLENPVEQSLVEVGAFLAGIISGREIADYGTICEEEKDLFYPFIELFPDNREKYVTNSGKDCCGCLACVNVCPVKAIKVEIDEKGFWYPKVNQNVCVKCGKCKKVCAFLNSNGIEPKFVYGVKHKDELVRSRSRSGGAFTGFSDTILKENGIIYGASLTDDFLAKHSRASSAQERDSFLGSKYIQSDMSGVYEQIKEDLEKGRKCLFSGTPCQVAAVKNYFGENTNLYLIDIVCHGVPSPLVWRDYLDFQETSHDGKVTKVDFRDKRFGWKAHRETFVINDQNYDEDIFTKLFYSHLILRPSCFNCPYKCTAREGDITIADFWGIDTALPGFNDDKGVSLVLVNTAKGKELFDLSKDSFIYLETKLADAMQNSLKFPYPKPENYDEFWDKYNQKGMHGYIVELKQKKKEQVAYQKELMKKEKMQRVKQKIKVGLGKIWRLVFSD